MTKEKQCCEHGHDCEEYEMNDFERYMAVSWGTPTGLLMIVSAVAILLISSGVFLWFLHLANIIK